MVFVPVVNVLHRLGEARVDSLHGLNPEECQVSMRLDDMIVQVIRMFVHIQNPRLPLAHVLAELVYIVHHPKDLALHQF